MSKWEWKKLGEVAKIYNGNSINANVKKERYSNVESGFPFIATKDVGNDSEVDYENGIRIPFEEAGFKVARKDTVLICAEGGSAGKKKCILNEDVCFGNKLFAIDYNREKLIGKFVFYYTFEQSFTDEFQKLLSGIIGGVSSAKFKEIQIPIPPLSEQKRIVKFLDEEFSKIETLKTNAETNLKNAKELFETTLEKELNLGKDGALPSGWEWKTLQEVCLEKIKDGTHQTPKYCNADEGVPFLSAKDITTGQINWDRIKYIVPELHEELYSKIAPKKNDVLLAKNGTTGVGAIVENDAVFDIYVTLALLRPNQKIILPRYLLRVVNSPLCKKQFDAHLKGIGVPNLHLNEIQKVQIPLPPLSVQKEIVARLDKLSENVKRLEANYKQIIADCDELKKSILKKTFEGES